MQASRPFILSLLVASLFFVLPGVFAQSTAISELSYPSGIAPDSLNPVSVTATVSYEDAGPGYSLVVGVLDVDKSPSNPIQGVATSSPDVCVNQPILAAYCVARTSGSSGVEKLEFKIGGILSDQRATGNWNLSVTAALYNANNTLIASSMSSVPFTIAVSPATLTVIVPAKAIVWVDGVKQQPGTIQIPVSGGPHNITVPAIVDVDAATRLRFDHWADSMTQPNRTVTINLSSSLEAVYVTQYRLSFSGQTQSALGEGWYDSGSLATFSVAEAEQMSGLLGLLGGRLKFQGWYENNSLLSGSPVDTILMNRPRTLTVLWRADYTMPIVILGLIVVVAIVLAYVAMRRRTTTTPHESVLPSREVRRPETKPRRVKRRASRSATQSRNRSSTIRRTR